MQLIRPLLVLALTAAAAFASAPVPKYIPLQFSEMAMTADLIVHGEITVLTKDSFTLEIEELIHGQLSSDAAKTKRIDVKRFQNWVCASRWHEYAPGQKVLLFLRAPKADSKLFQIMSAGGEGEMFVTPGATSPTGKSLKDQRVVSVRGQGIESLDQVKNIRMGLIAQASQPGQLSQARLSDLIHAIRNLHACYQIELGNNKGGRTECQVKQLATKDEIAKLAQHSKVAALLVKTAREFIKE